MYGGGQLFTCDSWVLSGHKDDNHHNITSGVCSRLGHENENEPQRHSLSFINVSKEFSPLMLDNKSHFHPKEM